MTDIQLSKNFKLSELTRSETARRRKINNDAPESVIENLRNLCQNVVYYMKKISLQHSVEMRLEVVCFQYLPYCSMANTVYVIHFYHSF